MSVPIIVESTVVPTERLTCGQAACAKRLARGDTERRGQHGMWHVQSATVADRREARAKNH
jgi:hypothetical protein